MLGRCRQTVVHMAYTYYDCTGQAILTSAGISALNWKHEASHAMTNGAMIPISQVRPALLPLNDLRELLHWYRLNLCEVEIHDPRGHRVRFLPENFVHLIKLTTRYGKEPRNASIALDEIERGRIRLVAGRFDSQRASELSWIRSIAADPWRIVLNWQALGRGDEAYVRNFGTANAPVYRVLVCEAIGTLRQAVTVFPRERMSARELATILWP